ncbi:uncharacterized protein LOC102807808 [Saccoglossus kowalevskii]
MATNDTVQKTTRNHDSVLKTAIDVLKKSLRCMDSRRLGIRLGLSDADLNSLEHDYPRDLREQIYQMFEMWKGRRGNKATIAILIAALKDEGLNNMAQYIEQLVGSEKGRGNEVIVRTIDTYEDVVCVTEKIKVEVPRNAVPEVVSLTFQAKQMDARKLCIGPREPDIIECLELGPDGYKFLKPLTLCYKLPKVVLERSNVIILALTSENCTGPWTKLKTWKEGSNIKVEVEHFSYLAIVFQKKDETIKMKYAEKKLAKERDQKLKSVVSKISPALRSRDWKSVARALHFIEADIDAIEKDYANDFQKQKDEMFHRWRSRVKHNASAETLIDVLIELEMYKLAEEAEKALTVMKTDTKQKKSIFKSSAVNIGL